MSTINLRNYGSNDRFEQEASFYEGMFLARISEQHHSLYKVISEEGELKANISGKLQYAAEGTLDYPSVGDWVMIDKIDKNAGTAVIRHILRRKSVFVRKAAGTSETTQIVAANIDTIFVCMSLNTDFNLRRLERYLSVAWESMATPVIVLTKADLCNDINQKLADVDSVSAGADVIVCSSMDKNGYQSVREYISEGKTIAFIGSSGVGKSTLINRLLGEDRLKTRNIRAYDDRGRHATTHRQLIGLPDGGIVIDTPGMREMKLYTGNLEKTFEDIEVIAENCKFNDCSHTTEPGCAVKKAIETGELLQKRFESYLKLQREMNYEGLSTRQLEQEKINRIFGSKNEMKNKKREARKKYNR